MSDTGEFSLEAFMAANEADADFDIDSSDKKPARRDKSVHEVDLSQQAFEPVENVFMDKSTGAFDDPKYYKTVMSGESAAAQRLHGLLSKYLPCTDPKDKTVYRQQIMTAYWEFLRSIAPKMANLSTPQCKRMVLRYGVVLPSLFSAEQKDFFNKARIENETREPILYMDEWIREIAAGRMGPSATDEGRPSRKSGDGIDQQQIMQLQSKNTGKLQNAENLLNMRESQRAMLESELKNRIDMLCEHEECLGFYPHRMPYNEAQLHLFVEINERLRALQKNNKELNNYLREFQEAKDIESELEAKRTEAPKSEVALSNAEINGEVDTIRQMAKMTVGRQGNHFPVFTREFFHCMPKGTGFRENVINILHWIESIDPGAFKRLHRNIWNRIVPYVLLVPTYGDRGICWEPFDRYNRVSSRGRIVVPMYPRDLKIAIITAVADLRWQVAKEKASFYWMEEGLTGQYFQWIDSQKLKGDLKEYFIADYVLWITKESEGTQKLEKEVRGIFWRHLPFSQEIKEKLKTRSVTYQELYQRDINRSMSDGY